MSDTDMQATNAIQDRDGLLADELNAMSLAQQVPSGSKCNSAMEAEKEKRAALLSMFRSIMEIREAIQHLYHIKERNADCKDIRDAPIPAISIPNADVKVDDVLDASEYPINKIVIKILPPGDSELHRECEIGAYGVGQDLQQLNKMLEVAGVTRDGVMIEGVFEELGIGEDDEIYQFVLGQPK